MKKIFVLLILLCTNFPVLSAQEKQILVFYKTAGFYHESIPAGIEALQQIGIENNLSISATEDANIFSDEDLKQFHLVIFLNTTGNILDEKQQKAFENYISKGGNFFGIHSAADTEYEWEWYGKLVGAYFMHHPDIQEAEVRVLIPDHPTVAHLPQSWKRVDEWYNYKNINPEIKCFSSLMRNLMKEGKTGLFIP